MIHGEWRETKNRFISVNYCYKWHFYCLNCDFTFSPVKEQWLCDYNNEELNRNKMNHSQSYFLFCSFVLHHAYSLGISLTSLMTEWKTWILHVLYVFDFQEFLIESETRNIHFTCSESRSFSALEMCCVIFYFVYRCHCCHMCWK